MKFSISDFFEKGQFWTSLKKSLEALKINVDFQADQINQLQRDNRELLDEIRRLWEDNRELSARLNKLDDRIYELNGSSLRVINPEEPPLKPPKHDGKPKRLE